MKLLPMNPEPPVTIRLLIFNVPPVSPILTSILSGKRYVFPALADWHQQHSVWYLPPASYQFASTRKDMEMTQITFCEALSNFIYMSCHRHTFFCNSYSTSDPHGYSCLSPRHG